MFLTNGNSVQSVFLAKIAAKQPEGIRLVAHKSETSRTHEGIRLFATRKFQVVFRRSR